jgi:EAL domain-containing protein (putative c-di-GMP-specific phosphodiesterase class I)
VLLVTPGKPLPRVCINLSGASLKTDQLQEHILHEVELSEVSPQCIEFEITETYDASFNEREYRLVDHLRQRGFRFAIDDFGSGYTSLNKMAEFPVDVIKLDRLFINRMVAARHDAGSGL